MEKKNRVPALGELTMVCVVCRRDGKQKIKLATLKPELFRLVRSVKKIIDW